MAKYYNKITNRSELKSRSGSAINFPVGFCDLSAKIISRCSFLQNQIQRVIYITHGPEILSAKKALTDFPNPKARMDFLTTFPYSDADPVVSAVFDYTKILFLDIYELRNILSHEDWMCSDDYREAILFSSINESARLMMASGKLLHMEEATSKETYNAIIRYIKNIKIVTCKNLQDALKDADLCA